MVIDNDHEAPTEVSTVMESKLEKNTHFCTSELNKIIKKEAEMTSQSYETETSDFGSKRKHKKVKKSSRKKHSSTSDSKDNRASTMEISEEDILQLRTVYKQCKSVLRKMEFKYGHLLDEKSSDSTDAPSKKRSKLKNAQIEEGECQCSLNKKIVFDEEGNEVLINTATENHICPTKLMSNNHFVDNNTEIDYHTKIASDIRNKNIEIEYYSKNTELTDNLQELISILKDSSIETTYRNKVIEKVRLIKQEQLNDVRFNKLSLIEKSKTKPDEVFSFDGSNLSTMPGYCY